MKVAYADPPYVGQAKKHYAHDRRVLASGEVDHKQLIERLCRDYDAWALSCSSPSLKEILSYCPDDVRVLAWVKPFCAFKVNVGVAYAWEPVIVWRGRRRTREQPTVRDWLSESIALEKGLVGAKPARFCYWLFDVLNLQPDDEFHDLFPGTGGVMRAWKEWKRSKQQGLLRAIQ
jgi:hypothetical protein